MAAGLIKQLKTEEWQALRGLERAMFGGRSTDVEAVSKFGRLPRDRVKFALNELNKRRLVGSNGDNYLLYTTALDLLALKHYADVDRAISLGKLIAKGKESDVYEVLSAKSELYALKFFRLGRSSFRDVKRKRASSTSETHSWVSSNYNASKHEFAALRRLRPFTPNVADAVDQDRHTLLLGELPGVRLATRPELGGARGDTQDDNRDGEGRVHQGRDDTRRPERVQHPDRGHQGVAHRLAPVGQPRASQRKGTPVEGHISSPEVLRQSLRCKR